MNNQTKPKPKFQKPNVKYSLGLDLGITSVGWAVMAQKFASTKDKVPAESTLHDFGVHLFDAPADLKAGISDAQKRRKFRAQRRLIRRRTQRIARMRATLERAGYKHSLEKDKKLKQTNQIFINEKGQFYLKDDFQNIYFSKYKAIRDTIKPEELYWILLHSCKKRGYLNKFEDEKGKKDFDSIQADTKKLLFDEKGKEITVSEAFLTNPLFRINWKKGQKSFLLYVKNGKLQTKDNQKVGEAFYRNLFSRAAFQYELQKILDFQCELQKKDPFWQKIAQAKDEIIKNIIEQRDFEVGAKCKKCQDHLELKQGDRELSKEQEEKLEKYQCPNKKNCSRYPTFLELTGKCIFHPEEKRGYKSSLLFSAWQIIGELCKMLQGLKSWGLNFSKETFHDLFREFFLNPKRNPTTFQNFLKTKTDDTKHFAHVAKNKAKSWKDGVAFKPEFLKYIEQFDFLKKFIPSISTTQSSKELIALLEDPANVINQIGLYASMYKTPARLKKAVQKILKNHDISIIEKELDSFLKDIRKKTGVAKVSFTFMKEEIETFWNGRSKLRTEKIEYGKFNFEKLADSKSTKLRPFKQLRDIDMERNPVVFQAINESRKVLKALNNHYGEFHSITIEVASDVSKPLKKRNQILQKHKKHEEEKKLIEEKLSEFNIFSNYTNILRFKLWKEQDKQCLYCEKDIEFENAFSPSAFHIDHIVPQSIWGDDSRTNKVLVCSPCNYNKGNQLPLQYLKGEEAQSFQGRVNTLYKSKKSPGDKLFFKISYKKQRYLLLSNTTGEEFDEFISQSLNNTRYIAKWFAAYVKKQIELLNYKTKILVLPGQITSFLRRQWLQASPWGLDDKVRDITDYHHAVDAMILAQIKGQTFIELILDIRNLLQLKEKYQNVHDKAKESVQKEWDTLHKSINIKWACLNEKHKESYSEHVSLLERWAPSLLESNNKFSSLFIHDLVDQIHKRIPVKLKLDELTDIEAKSSKTKHLPKLDDVLNEEEMKKQLNSFESTKEENLRFPHISRRQRYKIPRDFRPSENFGFTGGDRKTKNKIFNIWFKNKDAETHEFENIWKLMKRTYVVYAIRSVLDKIHANSIDEATSHSLWKQWSGFFQSNLNLKNEIHDLYFDQDNSKRTLPKPFFHTSVNKLIQYQLKKDEKKIEKKLKEWISEFRSKKSYLVKDGTPISIEKYYGFFIDEETKTHHWITNFAAQKIFKDPVSKNSHVYKAINYKKLLFIPNVLFRHYDDKIAKTRKKITKNYVSKAGEKVRIFANGLSNKIYSSTFFNESKNIWPTYTTNTLIKDFFEGGAEIIQIDILGNELKSDKIFNKQTNN